MIGDHYEPMWGRPAYDVALGRVMLWRVKWPEIASRHADSDGRPPQYTFFYPEEEYRPELVDPLAEMTRQGIADVEIHLHHDRESEEDFVSRIARFKVALFRRHGLLRERNGQVVFAFIHGNWALDNSLPGGRFCGLNNEISLLKQLGCYADFTLPSAPSAAQTRTVNRIYWAIDDPRRPKSHDRGAAVRPGVAPGDLLMVQGPLGVRIGQDDRWKPRLDTGGLDAQDPPTAARVQLWLRIAPLLGEHAFLKLFTHGTQEKNSAMLLGGGLDRLFEFLVREAAVQGFHLHFATAWDVYNAIEAYRTGSAAAAGASPSYTA